MFMSSPLSMMQLFSRIALLSAVGGVLAEADCKGGIWYFVDMCQSEVAKSVDAFQDAASKQTVMQSWIYLRVDLKNGGDLAEDAALGFTHGGSGDAAATDLKASSVKCEDGDLTRSMQDGSHEPRPVTFSQFDTLAASSAIPGSEEGIKAFLDDLSSCSTDQWYHLSGSEFRLTNDISAKDVWLVITADPSPPTQLSDIKEFRLFDAAVGKSYAHDNLESVWGIADATTTVSCYYGNRLRISSAANKVVKQDTEYDKCHSAFTGQTWPQVKWYQSSGGSVTFRHNFPKVLDTKWGGDSVLTVEPPDGYDHDSCLEYSRDAQIMVHKKCETPDSDPAFVLKNEKPCTRGSIYYFPTDDDTQKVFHVLSEDSIPDGATIDERIGCKDGKLWAIAGFKGYSDPLTIKYTKGWKSCFETPTEQGCFVENTSSAFVHKDKLQCGEGADKERELEKSEAVYPPHQLLPITEKGISTIVKQAENKWFSITGTVEEGFKAKVRFKADGNFDEDPVDCEGELYSHLLFVRRCVKMLSKSM